MKIGPRYEMTPENLEEAIRMAEASTPLCRWGSVDQTDEDGKRMLAAGVGDEVFMAWAPEGSESLAVAVTGNGPTSEANARFFAHARDIVLALAEEVKKARASSISGDSYEKPILVYDPEDGLFDVVYQGSVTHHDLDVHGERELIRVAASKGGGSPSEGDPK